MSTVSVEALIARADKIKARNVILESVKGSGYHDDDRDFRGQFCSPQKRHLPGGQDYGALPLPPISQHCVPFYDRRQVVFVGDCAERVLAALRQWHADHITADISRLMSYTGTEQKLLTVIPELTVEDGRLAVWRDTWNDVHYALEQRGIGFTGAPLIPDGTTP
jgi:hypothetical protein